MKSWNEVEQIEDQSEPIELIDRMNPMLVRRFIIEAIERFAASSRDECWRLRRERVLHLTQVIERNLDYDLQRLGTAGLP